MRRVSIVLLAAVVAGMAPRTTSAQLGGLIKKAKDATAKKVEGDQAGSAAKGAFGPTLTEPIVDQTLKGAAAARAKIDAAAQLQAQQKQLGDQMTRANADHDALRQQYDDQSHRVESCRSDEFRRIDDARQKRMSEMQQQMMNDPAKLAAMVQETQDAGRAMAMAQVKGDTAGVRKMQQERQLRMMKQLGIDPKADTAQADKACGALPPRPAALAADEALRSRWQQGEDHLRQLQDSVEIAGAAAAGMTRPNFAVVRERIAGWVHERQGGSKQSFTDEERRILESRKSQIDQYAKVFRW